MAKARKLSDARIGQQILNAQGKPMSQPAVNRRMLGRNEWTIGELQQLARILDVPYSDLVAEDEPVRTS